MQLAGSSIYCSAVVVTQRKSNVSTPMSGVAALQISDNIKYRYYLKQHDVARADNLKISFLQWTELKLSFIFLCQDCTICMEALPGPSGYKGPGVGGISRAESVGRLAQCGHQYHLQCLVAMYNNGNKDGSLQCPTCKTIYGVKTGNQPPGKMEYHVIPHSLPGHPDCKTIRIIYNIPPGIQVHSVYRCLCGASSVSFWMKWQTVLLLVFRAQSTQIQANPSLHVGSPDTATFLTARRDARYT